jgi:hypothetical protein
MPSRSGSLARQTRQKNVGSGVAICGSFFRDRANGCCRIRRTNVEQPGRSLVPSRRAHLFLVYGSGRAALISDWSVFTRASSLGPCRHGRGSNADYIESKFGDTRRTSSTRRRIKEATAAEKQRKVPSCRGSGALMRSYRQS